jgi:hypothetical protein
MSPNDSERDYQVVEARRRAKLRRDAISAYAKLLGVTVREAREDFEGITTLGVVNRLHRLEQRL